MHDSDSNGDSDTWMRVKQERKEAEEHRKPKRRSRGGAGSRTNESKGFP